MMGNLGNLGKTLVVSALLIAIYLNYPAPDPSADLEKWVEGGKYFSYNGHRIFYKGEQFRRLLFSYALPYMLYT